MNKKVLIFSNYFIPGSLAGGPIRSIEGIIKNLQNELDFYVITSSHDYNCTENYKNIITNKWVEVENFKCFYVEDNVLTLRKYFDIISYVNPGLIYFNSFFNYKYTILPLLLLKIFNLKKKVLIASRGEFGNGALAIKKNKKFLYIYFFRFFLQRNLYWHASSLNEKSDIKRLFKESAIFIANNIPITIQKSINPYEKKIGSLSILFLSRISIMKNLYGAMKAVSLLEGEVFFDIYGPVEDKEYFNKIMKVVLQLPKNIKVIFHGSLSHSDVYTAFEKCHILFLPTLGENFGNVIRESILHSRPVLIGNTTPWNDIEKSGAGWSLDPYDYIQFSKVLGKLLEMDSIKYKHLVSRVEKYSQLILNDEIDINKNRNMFLKLLG